MKLKHDNSPRYLGRASIARLGAAPRRRRITVPVLEIEKPLWRELAEYVLLAAACSAAVFLAFAY